MGENENLKPQTGNPATTDLSQSGQQNEIQKPQTVDVENIFSGSTKHLSSTSKTLTPSKKLAQTIQKKRLNDSMRRVLRTRNLTASDTEIIVDAIKVHGIQESIVQAKADNFLRHHGLWKEKPDEIPFAEVFPERRGDEFRGLSDRLYNEGTLLGNDDITIDDNLGEPGNSGNSLLPSMAVANFYNLMRPPPETLEQSVARGLVDGPFFIKNYEVKHLVVACLLFSRNVKDLEHFTDLFVSGLSNVNPNYTFDQYDNDLIELNGLIKNKIKSFFDRLPFVRNRALSRPDLTTKSALDVWGRLRGVRSELTAKQRHALIKLFGSPHSPTYEDVAQKMKISVDSLRDRVRGAVTKVRREFPEFDGLYPLPSNDSQKRDLYLNGLWRASNAKKVAPLFRIDPITGERLEIPRRTGTIKMRKVSAKEITEIKAHIIEATPIPNIIDTDYFLGMKPGIFTQDEKPKETDSEDED